VLGGEIGRSGHLLNEAAIFLQRTICSGVFVRPHEHCSNASSRLNFLWYHAKSPFLDLVASRRARVGRGSSSSFGVFVVI